MLRPVSSFRICAATCVGEPWRKSCLNTSAALSSGGMATPVPVHERLRDARVDGERERGEAGEHADLLGDVLVERDGIAKRAAARMRRGGEETDVRRVPAIHVRMRDAAEHGEVIAVRLEHIEIGRRRIIAAGARGEELIREQAEIVADGEHPARLRARAGGRAARRGPRKCGPHRVEERERHHDPRAAEKLPARERLPRGDERADGGCGAE